LYYIRSAASILAKSAVYTAEPRFRRRTSLAAAGGAG
jgi:hypothetical protein